MTRFMFKNNASKGMTFIEITIGLMIASMISLMLFRFLGQTTRISRTVEATLDYSGLIPLAYDQLERDITAIYVPDILYDKKTPVKKQPPKKSSSSLGTVDKGALDKTQKEEIKPIPFYGEIKNNLLTLSFVTTNRLVSFKRKNPYCMYVVYRTLPDETYEGLFKLVRQQSTDLLLPLKKFEEGVVPSFTLLRGIKSCSIRLRAPKVIKKTGKSTVATEKQDEKFSVVESWIPEKIKKDFNVYIPEYVEIEGIFVDSSRLQERPFKFIYKVQSFEEHAERMK